MESRLSTASMARILTGIRISAALQTVNPDYDGLDYKIIQAVLILIGGLRGNCTDSKPSMGESA